MGMLVHAGSSHPPQRDRVDNPAHPVATQQRRGSQGVCQTEVGVSPGGSQSNGVIAPPTSTAFLRLVIFTRVLLVNIMF